MGRKLLAFALSLGLSACAVQPPVEQASTQAVAEAAPVSEADLSEVWARLPAMMAERKLAGLSVTVFDNYRVVESQTFGTKEAGLDAPIDTQTAFSTASIAKPVTALLALILEARGEIDLDAPVATYLQRWELPESELDGTDGVTLRQLLAHMAGTSQHGFADFYEGDEVPSIVDSLEGRIPRYDKPIEFLFEPGSSWKYSGGGYVIVQMAIEDHTGRPLAELVEEEIFEPLAMTRTTMKQPGEAGFLDNAARVHDKDGAVIKTGLPITPQLAASGVWSTPDDLAKLMIALQRGLAGENSSLVTPSIARELTQIVAFDHVGGMAMPFFRGFGFGNTAWIRHDGSNTGVNADMLASPKGGYGVIMMGNGDDPSTNPIFAFLRSEVIDGMNWAERYPHQTQALPAKLLQALPGTYAGLLYGMGFPYTIEAEGDALWVTSPFFAHFLGRPRSEMKYLGDNEFVVMDYPNRLRFELDESGALASVVITRPGATRASITRSLTPPGE